MSSWYGG
ncbi:hypothetical protein AYI69_g282, partial [Smittium culicis]